MRRHFIRYFLHSISTCSVVPSVRRLAGFLGFAGVLAVPDLLSGVDVKILDVQRRQHRRTYCGV